MIQSRLFDVGSSVATPSSSSESQQLRTEFDVTETDQVEQWIDEMDAQLPPLTNFILPSGTLPTVLTRSPFRIFSKGIAATAWAAVAGGLASASLHLARAICRRAERSLVPLFQTMALEEPPAVCVYLNRLSDYLFTAARRAVRASDF